AAMAIASSTLAYAQQRQQRQVDPDRFAAAANARIAALKAGLELTPDQAQKWPTYQQSLESLVQLRVERLQARRARQAQGGDHPRQRGGDPFARLTHRADNMT